MSIFDWFKKKEDLSTPTKIAIRRPAPKDYTESYNVNRELTKGLYHNSYPGLKLAGSLAFAPIAIPVWFMGIPVIKVDEENTVAQEWADLIMKRYYRRFKQIQLQCLREGTIWIFPKFSAKLGRVVWEFITDDAVTDILKDLDTGEMTAIITEEEIKISTGYNKTATVKRRRVYEKTKITITHEVMSGNVDTSLLDKTTRNVAGVLPIPFANNTDGEENRGHSDYERIVPDLKMYHDTEYASQVSLSKFNIKMVQTVRNYNTWLANLLAVNGWTSEDEIDLAALDLIINEIEEKTEFVWPQGAHQAIEAKLKTLFKKIVEGSGIPEIFWGLKTEGNHASAEEQMNVGIMYVESKQDQLTDKYETLIEKTIYLERMANMVNEEIDIEITWNDLEAVSPEIKAKIFADYARGFQMCVDGATASKEQLFKLWKMVYPQITEDEFETWKTGISDMAAFKQYREMDYSMAQDLNEGADPQLDEEPDEEPDGEMNE